MSHRWFEAERAHGVAPAPRRPRSCSSRRAARACKSAAARCASSRRARVTTRAPNVEHWHGATPDSEFTQVALSRGDAAETVWLEKVTATSSTPGVSQRGHASSFLKRDAPRCRPSRIAETRSRALYFVEMPLYEFKCRACGQPLRGARPSGRDAARARSAATPRPSACSPRRPASARTAAASAPPASRAVPPARSSARRITRSASTSATTSRNTPRAADELVASAGRPRRSIRAASAPSP